MFAIKEIINENELPLVSVITVNYNGKRFLPRYFSALQDLKYPVDKLEMIFVDNASSDGSIEYVKENFPGVRIIQNSTNLGFAEGNNVAIRMARGEYMALLNNDTAIDRNWLIELVKIARSDARIGASTSKILFFCDFITLVIRSDKEMRILINEINTNVSDPDLTDNIYSINYLEGFNKIKDGNTIKYKMVSDSAKVRIPICKKTDSLSIKIKIGAFGPAKLSEPEMSFFIDNIHIKDISLQKNRSVEYGLIIPESVINVSKYKIINNVGSIIFKDGHGADRGFYQEDRGQFDKIEEVFSACGASVLYKKTMLDDAGIFDEDFFMYYEDTDLAWRARLKGWKIIYTPYSIVNHIHCGSSVEWSPFFIFHAERNRLFMLIKNGSLKTVISSVFLVTGFTLFLGIELLFAKIRNRKDQNSTKFPIYVKVICDMIRKIPGLLAKRSEIQKSRSVENTEISRWMATK